MNIIDFQKKNSELEQHCISLKIAMQLNKEIFQKTNTCVNQTEPSFDQLFELNNLKAELQGKDTTIKKLKAHIKRINETSTSKSVKKDFDEIETINIELEHKVTRLIAENEHLKQTYKQLYDSIKPSRVRAKEQTESLVNQVNQKPVKFFDLNAQLQEKVFFITSLKNDLRKLKGNDIVANAAQMSNDAQMSNAATIAPEMYNLDLVILAPKVKNNRKAHEYNLKHTMEQASILMELLGYVRDTCPDIHKPSEKLVAVMPINKKKTVQFVDTVTSSCNIPKVTNRPLLSSTRVKPSTIASGSKPLGNTKNDRISRTPSSNEKNKVEVQSRKVKSKLNKQNTDSKNVCNQHVKHPVKEWNPVHLEDPIHQLLHPLLLLSIAGCPNGSMIGNVTISRVYYVEGLGHNLFSVGQFCNSDLEVAFRKHTCFVHNLEGVDLLSGSRGTNLYSLSIGDMMASSHICLLSKATKTKSWLWHRPRSNHINLNLKTPIKKNYIFCMDLCGPMRVASVNGKKYILVIVDDYSRFTWVKFLASKDEDLDFIIKFLKMIQVRLNAVVRNIRTDNGTKFVNQTLRDYYE
ncbi:retrovirus-related pol polyprotein from transposon TNT 1-94 [Tanacetum coccineum]